jgi:hypothetical protein
MMAEGTFWYTDCFINCERQCGFIQKVKGGYKLMKKFKLITLVAAASLCSGGIMAADPKTEPDASWISISGTVVEPTDSSFLLDYGDDVVIVEVDDWDVYAEAHPLINGDRVTVYGRVDNDLFEAAKIEAGAVFVQGLNTYIYASSADEEGDATAYYPYYWTNLGVPVTNDVTVRGMVTAVDPEQREFRIDRGNRELTVKTESMVFNPLDKYGYQRIQQGDVVSVTGNLDKNFFGGRVLRADMVTTLLDVSDVES